MQEPWARVRIADIAAPVPNAICLGPFGSNISSDNFVPVGVPVVRGVNLNAGRFVDNGFVYISEQKANELARSSAYPGDLIFTYKGTLGQVGIIPQHSRYSRYIVSQSQMKLSCDAYKVDPLFVFYFFRSPIGQHALLANSSSTGTPGINQPTKTLKSILMPLPSIPEQHAIASILGCLDDKIELNRRMNATLEETARAIFHAWFVDFEPVRAKAEGRVPQSADAATASLFPIAFDEIDGREVPRGWQVRPIGGTVRVVGGSTPSTTESAYWEQGTIPWATPKDMSALSSPILLRTERCITENGLQQISSGLLPKGTILMSSRAPIGYLAIAEIPVAINQGFIAMICDQTLPNYYMLLWAQKNLEVIKSRANGTTFLEISKAAFRPMEIVVPGDNVLEAFVSAVNPLFKTMSNKISESSRLTVLRDTLLPKLISVEVRVHDAEAFREHL